jgi:hypothetical protein
MRDCIVSYFELKVPQGSYRILLEATIELVPVSLLMRMHLSVTQVGRWVGGSFENEPTIEDHYDSLLLYAIPSANGGAQVASNKRKQTNHPIVQSTLLYLAGSADTPVFLGVKRNHVLQLLVVVDYPDLVDSFLLRRKTPVPFQEPNNLTSLVWGQRGMSLTLSTSLETRLGINVQNNAVDSISELVRQVNKPLALRRVKVAAIANGILALGNSIPSS